MESPLARQIRDIHYDMRSSARIIKDSRFRLLELQKVGEKSFDTLSFGAKWDFATVPPIVYYVLILNLFMFCFRF